MDLIDKVNFVMVEYIEDMLDSFQENGIVQVVVLYPLNHLLQH